MRSKIFYILFILLFFCTDSAKSQGLSAFLDVRRDFWAFDDGIIKKIAHLPIEEYKIGYKHIVFVDNTSQLKLYTNGQLIELNETTPTSYFPQKNFFLFNVNNNLKIYYDGRVELLSPLINGNYKLSDSIVAYADRFGAFKKWQNGRVTELEFKMPKSFSVADDLIAFVNYDNTFKLHQYGSTVELMNIPPQIYQVAHNTVSYIDQYDQFHIYNNGNFYTPESFKPSKIATGNGIVAYVDHSGVFKVYYNGVVQEIFNQAPKMFRIEDDVLYYIDLDNYFHIYYKGEDIIAETFAPKYIKSDNSIVAYTDLDGKLKAFIDGKLLPVSNNITDDRFRIDGRVIRYIENTNLVNFYYEGNTYFEESKR